MTDDSPAAIAQRTLDRLRLRICRCCGLQARGANMRDPETECDCIIEDIHEIGNLAHIDEDGSRYVYSRSCGKCAGHCMCDGALDADGYWRLADEVREE